MKANMRFVLLALTVIVVVSLTGCNLMGRLFNPPPEIDLQATAAEVTPVFSGTASASSRAVSGEISQSSPLYDLWYCLQEYVNEIHEGVLDGSNIYKFLYDANVELDHAFARSNAIDLTEIAAPFPMGEVQEYDFAANREEIEGTKTTRFGTAYRVSGDEVYFLLTSHWDEDYDNGGQLTLCQIQGVVNQATGDIELGMTYLVSYSYGEDYVVRSELAGNQVLHEFDCRVGVFNQQGGQWQGTSFTGSGVSQGADNVFLIKLDTWNGATWSGESYYVFPGDADATSIAAMDPAGYTDSSTLPDSVSSYATDVESAVLFTWDDVPHALADFNGGTIELAF